MADPHPPSTETPPTETRVRELAAWLRKFRSQTVLWAELDDYAKQVLARFCEPAPPASPSTEEGARDDGLTCTRCCQPLPADLADREALADYSVKCGPDCLCEPASGSTEEETCPRCHDLGWMVDSNDPTRRVPSLEVVPCTHPKCWARGRPVSGLTFDNREPMPAPTEEEGA